GQEFIGQEVYTYNAVIKYDKVQEAKWMPTLLIINSTQTIKSQKGDEYELERSIGEKLEFSNYIINKNSALEWFSTN
ncbi:MAG: hypothetical protein KDC67_17725, partial [Ignavibacteriae bacterium]|nr:hypothetical protein [Ignavibacteriota bacterium]